MATGDAGPNPSGDAHPPPLLNHHTTVLHLLSTTTSTALSLLPTLLLLSFLLFSFHSSLDSATSSLTSSLLLHPSLPSLFSKLPLSPNSNTNTNTNTNTRSPNPNPRRRPFLHLTRVGTLDDGFLSAADDDDARSLFPSHGNAQVNSSTFVSLSDFSKLGFSASAVTAGVGFKLEDTDRANSSNERNSEQDEVLDLRFFVPGLELGRRDAYLLFYLIGVLSVVYGWVVLGFVVTYSWVSGIVFVSVVNDLVGRGVCLVERVWMGSRLGVKRLSSFVLMRWAVRDALTQFLGLWYFGEVEDQYAVFKLFLRLKLMPFSSSAPWIGGYEKEVSGFLFAWFVMDTVVSFVLSVDCWVTLVDGRRRSEREALKEGCGLLALMFNPAIQLKCLEVVLSGSFVRWGLAQICGRSVALMFQSLVKVYFMVAWLIFYFVAKNRDASLNGRTFGRRELEGLIEGLR